MTPENPYRQGSWSAAIWDALMLHKGNVFQTKDYLLPKVGLKPLVFKKHNPIKGEPKLEQGIYDQQHDCIRHIDRLAKQHRADFMGGERQTPPPEQQPEPKAPETPKGKWMGPEAYFRKHQEIRAECLRRSEIGEPVDEVSMRPALAAKALFQSGADWAGEYILDSMCKLWDEGIRHDVGVKKFDTAIIEAPEGYTLPNNCHKQVSMLLWLVDAARREPNAAIHSWIKGPKGTGKTFIARQMAEILGLEWGFTPMTAGASYTWLTGTYTIDGYVTRPFVDIYEKGGVFLFDEADAGDANMVMVGNAALAGDCFQNPVTGKMLHKHRDTVILAAGNTWGDGADANYRGRQAQDAAFLDRFVAGRIEVGYDNDLESKLFWEGLTV